MRYKGIQIIFAFIISTIIIGSGIYALQENDEIHKRKSTFINTEFDMLISLPSQEQIDSISKDSDVERIVPFINMNTQMSANNTTRVNLLTTDQNAHIEIGFFNENTRLDNNGGQGLWLDETAADNLNVSVGDKVSISVDGQRLDTEVTQIHMPTTYPVLSEGVAYLSWEKGFNEIYEEDIVHDFMLVESSDVNTLVNDTLDGYVPMANFKSEDTFIENFKDQNTQPDELNEEEWENEIKSTYESYKDSYMNRDYSNSVQIKSDIGASTLSVANTLEDDLNRFIFVTALVIPLSYFAIQIAFLFASRGQIKLEMENHGLSYNIMKRQLIFNYLAFHTGIITISALTLYLFRTTLIGLTFDHIIINSYLLGILFVMIAMIVMSVNLKKIV